MSLTPTLDLDDKTMDAEVKKAFESAFMQPGGGRMVSYRELQVIIPLKRLYQALEDLKHKVDKDEFMKSVHLCLELGYESIMGGKATLDAAMKYGADVCVWFANEILEGRQPLEETKQ